MRKIINLKGVKALSKNEQKLIHGGGICQVPGVQCYYGQSCGETSDCIDPTIEYDYDELDGYGCNEGMCGYA